MDHHVFSDSLEGTLLIGTVLKDHVCVSCNSRVMTRNLATGDFSIKTSPMENQPEVEEEVVHDKSFVKPDYVLAGAGSLRVIAEIVHILEVEASPRRNDGVTVDLEFLSATLQQAMNAKCKEKGVDLVQPTRFIMVAMDASMKLRMRGFGFKYGSLTSGKYDIDDVWCAGASQESRDLAKRVVLQSYEETNPPHEMFWTHRDAMIQVSKVFTGVGGNHKMLVVSVGENGQLQTEVKNFAFTEYYTKTGIGKDFWQPSYKHNLVSASPLTGLPETAHLGWGHWFTLRDLELATNHFSKECVLGEGGYGVVYKGLLMNGTKVAVKKLLNNLGQAEKEFRVEVEAIGHVRHKNLVRLLGYCVEGIHRMLVYEYVNNGNLEQWLHGAMRQHGSLSWEARMKVIQCTAKALAYLHEAIEPKVIHRDIKSSNILIDDEFNAKISDFGLAKLLDSGESHMATRVMGTFGYVAPEYANTGMLNEKIDVYSFGVLLLEAVTGRDPVDYGRPSDEINLVEWLKVMVGTRRAEEVVDPDLQVEVRPTTRALKRALLVALRCVDPEPDKRPKMSQVVRMLEEVDDYPFHEDRKNRKSRSASMDSNT